jgi:hypothetical protein
VHVIADNPIGESRHYPDSDKWGVQIPERRRLRSPNLDYFDGEEYVDWAAPYPSRSPTTATRPAY